MSEICQRCGESGEDRRTLLMACFYQMNELGLPFEEKILFHAEPEDCTPATPPLTVPAGMGGLKAPLNLTSGTVRCSGEIEPRNFYTLRVCKMCRSEWMSSIKKWFVDGQNAAARRGEEVGSGIFVMRLGQAVEISEEEWCRLNPDREPVRVGKK